MKIRYSTLSMGLLFSLSFSHLFAVSKEPIPKMTLDFPSTVTWNMGTRGGYSPYEKTGYLQEILFYLNVIPNVSTNYFITVGKSFNSSSYIRKARSNDNSLQFQLYKTPQKEHVLKELPEAVLSEECITGSITTIDSNEYARTELKFYLEIPSQQLVHGGDIYFDSFKVSLYEGEFGKPHTYELIEQKNVTIAVPVILTKELAIELRNFDIPTPLFRNLGDLVTGKSTQFRVYIRSNGHYRLSVKSKNNGRLISNDPDIPTTISYRFSLDNVAASPIQEAFVPILFFSGVTPQQGNEHIGTLILENVQGAFQGNYSETLYFIVE